MSHKPQTLFGNVKLKIDTFTFTGFHPRPGLHPTDIETVPHFKIQKTSPKTVLHYS